MSEQSPIILETAGETLGFDPQSGGLVSFRSRVAPDQEFIAWAREHPAFLIGYLDEQRQYRLTGPGGLAARVDLHQNGEEWILTAEYSGVAGFDLDVSFAVRGSPRERFSRWSIRVHNDGGPEILDVQFPFVVCRYDLGGASAAETVVLPQGYASGQLLRNFVGEQVVPLPASGPLWKQKLPPDSWVTWLWNEWSVDHYPGWQFAQFLAYHNDRAGLHLACNDTAGHVKRFKVLHRDPGFRLAVAHTGDWPRQGERALEYEILLGSFAGDWHDAAEIYRDWSLQQRWAIPLHRRSDVPEWLLDSPVYITIRPQGVLDEGPVAPLTPFLPYEKCIPLLEKVAARVEAPLVAVMMGWEHAGSWVYPDSFPPIGGDESLAAFTRMARERGWHVGTFSNGTQWIVGQSWNGYDGREYFRQHGGEAAVCRRADGTAWLWNNPWRPSYPCCMGTELTRRMALDYVKHVLSWGFESIQFFDQNCFAVTFACFAADHGHPLLPGRWMAEAMEGLVAGFREAANAPDAEGAIHSSEGGVNEYCLPLFQEADLRVLPPGYNDDVIPLYQFLFHECLVLQGMMSSGPEPYHLEISAAANLAAGVIPGGVLTGDGTLLTRETINWAPWEPKIGDLDHGMEMLRTATALRRGPGRQFLVVGRMLKPAEVTGIPILEWSGGGRANSIPAVFHSAWQAPDGRIGVVLANWTAQEQTVSVRDTRLEGFAGRVVVHTSGARMAQARPAYSVGGVAVTLPPLSCAMVEEEGPG